MSAPAATLSERRAVLQARCAAQREELAATLATIGGGLQSIEQRLQWLRRIPLAALVAGGAGLSLTLRRLFTVIEGLSWAAGLLRQWRRTR